VNKLSSLNAECAADEVFRVSHQSRSSWHT
jgi:hypothetical protein